MSGTPYELVPDQSGEKPEEGTRLLSQAEWGQVAEEGQPYPHRMQTPAEAQLEKLIALMEKQQQKRRFNWNKLIMPMTAVLLGMATIAILDIQWFVDTEWQWAALNTGAITGGCIVFIVSMVTWYIAKYVYTKGSNHES